MTARPSPLGILIASVASVLLVGIGDVTHGQSSTGVSNVDYVVEKDGTLVLRYDLLGTGNPSDLFRISVLVSTDGGANYSVTPRLVTGDVGPGVRSGAGKRIVWNVRDDVKRLQGDAVVFRVNADLETPPDFVDPPELRETPTVFELPHRHNGLITSSDSMHPIEFAVTSRTLSVSPLANPKNPPGIPTVCEIKQSMMPIEAVSGAMVTLGKGFWDSTEGGGEAGRFLQLVIAEPGDATKTTTLHLGDGLSTSFQFLGRIEAARRSRLPRWESTRVPIGELMRRTAVALGGVEQLRAVRDAIYTATFRQFEGTSGPGQGIASMEVAGPGRFRRETNLNGQAVVVASDGNEVWQQEPGKAPKKVDGAQAKYLRLTESHFDSLRLLDWGPAATITGQVNVGNRVAWRLERALPDGSRVWADIDAETAFPARFGLTSKGLPRMDSEQFDYAQFGDVRVARRSVEYVNGIPVAEVLMRSVQFNTGIPPQRFKLSR